jgi:membrane-bound lytic murein transglycosylase D
MISSEYMNSGISLNRSQEPRASGLLRQFKRNRLAALITSSLFLHACSVLPEHDLSNPEISGDNTSVNAPDKPFRSSRSIVRRPPAAVVNIPNIEAEEVILENVWERISNGLTFTSEHENEKILKEMAWYLSNQDYLLQVNERAAPFLYEIVEEIERRHLPMELALLPVIESAFNPKASSRNQATGLWQFMSATGNSMGLKQDWWYDGRMDPLASTLAALDYLETLYNRFDNDWLLALAAYNAGQGNVQRAIDTNKSKSLPTDFWSLPLPRETQAHIPRLLGLARLISDPEANGFKLPMIENAPAVVKFDLGRQVDLAMAAQLAGLDAEIVYNLNPGFKQWATHPDGPHELLIPISHAENFNLALAKLPTSEVVTWDRYQVQSGDTLGSIARRYRTQVAVLQQVNDIKNSRIIAGESLLIPRSYSATAPLSLPNAPVYLGGTTNAPQTVASRTHQVRSGDSLWKIANRYNLQLETLLALNNISTDSVLKPGQELKLQAGSGLEGSEQQGTGLQLVQHQIRRGDTLSQIARRYNVKLADLTLWNDIEENSILRPGQQLIIHLPQSDASIN